MYQYLRNLMDAADQVGFVDDVTFLDWGVNEKRIHLDGKQANGKRFRLILECEVEANGN